MNPLRTSPNPHLLEISVRPWLRRVVPEGEELSLDAVPGAELDRIAARKFHGVWLMGVWTTGAEGRRLALHFPDLLATYDRLVPGWTPDDIGGSPYSIAAYAPAPEIGGPDGLARFRERLHARGMGLVLDFVPNHLGKDHPWTERYPERLVTGTEEDLERAPDSWYEHVAADGSRRIFAHGRDPHFPGWADTVQVDYRNPDTRNAMTQTLRRIAEQCDGIRCDVAMLVLPDVFNGTWGPRPDGRSWDFWPGAVRNLRDAGHDTVLIAEAYWDTQPRLIEAGFDYAYDKDLYDLVLAGDARAIADRLRFRAAEIPKAVHFLENHDEERSMSTLGPDRIRSAAALTYGLPGIRFFFEGQAEGRRIRIPVQLSREPAEAEVPECLDFYERLWTALSAPLFHRGAWSPADVQPPGRGEPAPPLVGSVWQHGAELGIIVVNLSPDRRSARIRLPRPGDAGESILLRDELTGADFERNTSEITETGLFVELDGWGAHFFRRVLREANVPRRAR